MYRPPFIKYYYDTLVYLLKRGHRIHLGFYEADEPVRELRHQTLADDYPEQFSYSIHNRKRKDAWDALCAACSWGLDYLLYLNPAFNHANRLRERLEFWIHPVFVWLVNKCPALNTDFGHSLIRSILQIVYDSIPAAESMKRVIGNFEPDVFLATPLVLPGSLQCEYIRAARELGIITAVCVASWDNLTTKGFIKGNPDRVIVWNEIQRGEAVRIHNISPGRVIVTGAQYFDEWFRRQPFRDREEFCRSINLPPDRLVLLYMCSSDYSAPNETRFVRRWVEAIRNARNPKLSQAGILIRPYPERVEKWKNVDFGVSGGVVLWPPEGEFPLSEEGKSNFYDSIYHSFAVVGINTTALIESAIIGRPVLTIVGSEFNNSQTETLHFHYLRQENGGFLCLAGDLDDHVRQLEEIVERGDQMKGQVDRFVGKFVRPHGIETGCVPILARSIEEQKLATPERIRQRFVKKVFGYTLYPSAFLLKTIMKLRKKEAGNKRRDKRKLYIEAGKQGSDPLDYIRARKRGGTLDGT